MNRYGVIALATWKEFQPTRYARMRDPEGFFTDLGEEISGRIRQIRRHMESAEQAELDALEYLARVVRLHDLRRQAEELVFTDLVWPPSWHLVCNGRPHDRGTHLDGLEVTMDPHGGLMPADRAHKLWSLWGTALAELEPPGMGQTAAAAFEAAHGNWLKHRTTRPT